MPVNIYRKVNPGQMEIRLGEETIVIARLRGEAYELESDAVEAIKYAEAKSKLLAEANSMLFKPATVVKGLTSERPEIVEKAAKHPKTTEAPAEVVEAPVPFEPEGDDDEEDILGID